MLISGPDAELLAILEVLLPREPTLKTFRVRTSPTSPTKTNSDDDQSALHAGNYRLRPQVFEVNKWLILSCL
jgi:hypothetical protein